MDHHAFEGGRSRHWSAAPGTTSAPVTTSSWLFYTQPGIVNDLFLYVRRSDALFPLMWLLLIECRSSVGLPGRPRPPPVLDCTDPFRFSALWTSELIRSSDVNQNSFVVCLRKVSFFSVPKALCCLFYLSGETVSSSLLSIKPKNREMWEISHVKTFWTGSLPPLAVKTQLYLTITSTFPSLPNCFSPCWLVPAISPPEVFLSSYFLLKLMLFLSRSAAKLQHYFIEKTECGVVRFHLLHRS